jgi:hypothetical protein
MEKDKLTLTGIPGFKHTHSHEDVNGAFGGYRTWMVHYRNEETIDEKIAVYAFVGFYWDVGRQTPEQKVTRIKVAHLVTDALEEGVPPGWIAKAVGLCVKLWQEIKKNGPTDGERFKLSVYG